VGRVNVDLERPPADRPPLDPAVWERTETRRALAARDLAAVFRLLRNAGTSQRTIAALTGLAPSEVYEIGRGRRVMAYDVLCRIADGLGVPRGYLGLAYDSETAAFVSATSPDAAQREQDLDEVGALLAHAAEVAVGMQGGPAALRWAAPHEAGTPIPQRVGARDVEQLEAITAALRGLDHGHGGGTCREAVVAQTRWVHQLLHADAADDVRHRLLLASADLDNLAGWTSFDVGLYASARGYFARALTQARRAGHASLIANVLYRSGRLHLHQGLTREALRFFQLGSIAAAESGCAVTVAMLGANEAWAHAILGDREQTLRALGRAHDELGRAQGPVAPWVSFFAPADLEALAGMAWLELGAHEPARLTDARQSLTSSVAGRGSDMTRSRAFELTALAVASLLDGDAEAGLTLGHEAVDLAERVRSVRVLDRLAPLARAAAAFPRPGHRDLARRVASVAAG
jgi:transcriptional regulator with XRE-family HTH domain